MAAREPLKIKKKIFFVEVIYYTHELKTPLKKGKTGLVDKVI